MKQSLHFSALFLFLLLFISSCSKTSARSMASKQGQAVEAVKLNEIGSGGSAVDLEGTESINQLMGMEECEKGDEECLQRRMLSEAHLDYIYTQHHKP